MRSASDGWMARLVDLDHPRLTRRSVQPTPTSRKPPSRPCPVFLRSRADRKLAPAARFPSQQPFPAHTVGILVIERGLILHASSEKDWQRRLQLFAFRCACSSSLT